MTPKEDRPNFPMILIFMNFIMLAILTVASKPMEKAFDEITKNRTKEAFEKACQRIRETSDLHAYYYEKMYIEYVLVVCKDIQ